MFIAHHLLYISIFLYLHVRQSWQISVPPTWTSSSLLKAETKTVINAVGSTVNSGTSPVPSATITFPTSFPTVPNLAYGISHYESDDNLGSEMYQVNRSALTVSGFSVIVKISGNTDIWIVKIRYIGIAKEFPHHLNSFDNVPCNYPNSSASFTYYLTRTTGPKTYTNTINYTTQATAISSSYRYFSTPLTNNKILLFMTSMYFDGKGSQPTSPPFFAINIQASATPISTEQYNLVVVAGDEIIIQRLHYSMIIFDQVQVQASGQYYLYCDRYNFVTAGGSVYLPVEFVPNAIMALTDFASDRTQSLIKFFLQFQILANGSHGIYMPLSAPRNTSRIPITRFGFTLFYLKSWNCPVGYYFDLPTNMCVDCTILNCAQCLNGSYCKTCNTGYVVNTGTGLCDPIPCTLFQCLSCINSTYCGSCNTLNSYYLNAGSCLLCSGSNKFINSTSLLCETCTLTQCTTCTSLTQCTTCNNANGYFINTTDSLCYPCTLTQCTTCLSLTQCQTCNNLNGYFIKTSDSLCYPCALTGCITCLTLTQCQTCNNANGYFMNTSDSLCYPCTLTGCTTCTSLTQCGICNSANGYLINSNDNLCYLCTLTECTTCASLTQCTTCNNVNGYFINSTDSLCYPCTLTQCTTCLTLTQCQTCNNLNGYFIKTTDSLCYPCTLTECITCLTLAQCQTCNNANGYFINISDSLCYPCTLTECTTCTSLSQCQICNNANGYYINTNNNLCYPCSFITQCLTCTSLIQCTSCNNANDYYLNATDNLCYLCTLTGCSTCASLVQCTTCNNANGYFINSTDNLCYVCNVVNCNACDRLDWCLTCSPGYFQDGTGQCVTCGIIGCITCNSSSTCAQCDSQLYIIQPNLTCTQCPAQQFPNLSTNLCQACTIAQCTSCLTLTQCQTCNTVNLYYLNSNQTCSYCDFGANLFINGSDGLCYPCGLANCDVCFSLIACTQCQLGYWLNNLTGLCEICTMTGCLNCTDASTCVDCDEINSYVLTGTQSCQFCNSSVNQFVNATQQCQVCSLNQCLSCLSLTECVACNYNNNYYVQNGVCVYCNSSVNNFINSSLLCQTCSVPNCLTCLSLTECLLCDISTNHLVNITDKLCYPCAIPNCLQCSTFSSCALCDTSNQFFLNSNTGQCQPCMIVGCIRCSSLTTCAECDLNLNLGLDYTSPNRSLCGPCDVSCVCGGYAQPWDAGLQQCSALCGDGLLLLNQPCDDGNTVSGDGCSSTCVVQQYYQCIGQPSNCTRDITVQLQQPTIQFFVCNKLVIKIPFSTETTQTSSNTPLVTLTHPYISIQNTTKQESQFIVTTKYRLDLLTQPVTLNLEVQGQLIIITYNSSFPLFVYTQQQCKIINKSDQIVLAAQISGYGVLFLSLVSGKIVGLELFGVLQLGYFTLAEHEFLNAYLAPLRKFGIFNGLNLQIIQEEDANLPIRIKQMGFSASFLNNINVMLICIFAQLLISGIIFLLSKLLNNKKMVVFSQNFLKQGFVTLILFNSFNIAFSAGIHWKYADPTSDFFIIGLVLMFMCLAAMVITALVMEVTSESTYGEFKKKFKNNFVCRLFIPLTVIYRMILGLYIALKNDYSQSTLLILGISMIFLLYMVTNLPYTSAYQNYRSSLTHITMLYILFVSNYYREMKSTTPLQVKGRIYTPAIIELILMGCCLGVSGVAALYELYLFVKSILMRKKLANVKNLNNSNLKSTQQSDINLH